MESMIGGGSSDASLASILTEDDTTLDACEYNLPPIHELPTLDSILQEGDTASPYSSDSTFPVVDEASPLGNRCDSSYKRISDTTSIESSWSLNSSDCVAGVSNLVLTHLPGISAQIQSAESRAGTGGVTCISVSPACADRGGASALEDGCWPPVLVAVGTWHGRCLVFSSVDQVMLFCLGDGRSPDGNDTGAVSCIHLNQTGDRLLAGMARGHIFLYELSQGRLLMSFDECFERGVGILHIKFCSVSSTALFCDSGGCVFELVWQKRSVPLGRNTARSRCLFSGSRGEVITAEPLPLPLASTAAADQTVHLANLSQRSVVAMVTLSKVIVLSCRPSLHVLFTQDLSGSLHHPPLLGWQYVLVRRSDGVKTLDPVLAFARQSRLHFVQLEYDGDYEEVRFQPLTSIALPCTLLGLRWLHQAALLLLDTNEELWLWDVRRNKHLEKLDLSGIKLVYSASFFKGLATGGNVSKVMALLGNHCCYQSLVSCSGRLWLLGSGGDVLAVSLRGWLQRLQLLVDAGCFLAALKLAGQMLQDVFGPLVELSGSQASRRRIIAERMVALVIEWMESKIGLLRSAEECRSVVPHCVKYLVLLKRLDVLFERANSVFELDSVAHTIYLESLQPFMVSGKLVNVPPLIMKQFVSLYIETNRPQELEECLLSVSLASIDINQVLPLCLPHGLYDTLIRIHTEGMDDYTTPLVEMLTLLGKFVNSGVPLTDAQARLGHKLLVYVSSCLLGRHYPGRGPLPVPLVDVVKWNVLSTVTCVHSRRADDSELQYPYFRTLLLFDTGAFLDVLSLAFDEPEFGCELGMEQRQRLIDTLLSLVENSQLYTSTQIGAFFTFLARQLAQPGSVLSLSDEMFTKLVEHLTESGTSADHEQRQQVLTKLIVSGVLDSGYCTETLAHRAKQAQLYSVCELLHERKAEFSAVVGCMLQYPAGRSHVHEYIRSRAGHVTAGSCQPPDDVLSLFLDNIEALLEIDVARSADLLLQCFSNHVSDTLRRVDGNSRLQYQLTTVLISLDEESGWLLSLFGQLELLHLQLMCQLEPSAADQFIRCHQRRLTNTQQLIAICQRYNCDVAQACLLEITGQSEKALDLLMNRLTLLTKQECECFSTMTGQSFNVPSTTAAPAVSCSLPGQLRHHLVTCAQLCSRSTSREQPRLECWQSLLARALAADQIVTRHQKQTDGQSMCQLVISYMSSAMSVSELFQCLVSVPGKSSATVADLRPLIKGMVESCHYDRVLFSCLTSLLRQQCAVSVQRRNRLASRALSWHPHSLCALCQHLASAPPRLQSLTSPVHHGEQSTPQSTRNGEPSTHESTHHGNSSTPESIHHGEHSLAHQNDGELSDLTDCLEPSAETIDLSGGGCCGSDRDPPGDNRLGKGGTAASAPSRSCLTQNDKPSIYVCRKGHVFHMKCLQSVCKSSTDVCCKLCVD